MYIYYMCIQNASYPQKCQTDEMFIQVSVFLVQLYFVYVHIKIQCTTYGTITADLSIIGQIIFVVFSYDELQLYLHLM